MENWSKEELVEELMEREINFKRIDGAVAVIPDSYELNNSVAFNAVLHSHIIAFAFYEAKEAVKLVSALLKNYSSYELHDLANQLIGVDIVDFYKEASLTDYQILQGPLFKVLEQATADFGESFNGLEELYNKIEEIAGEDKQ